MYIELNENELSRLFENDLDWLGNGEFIIAPKKLVNLLLEIYSKSFINIEKKEVFIRKSLMFFRYFVLTSENIDTKEYLFRVYSKKARVFFPNIKKHGVTYYNYLKVFRENGIISKVSNYSTTFKVANKYEFNSDFFLDEFVLVLFKNEFISNYKVKNEVPNLNPKFKNTLAYLKLDIKNALMEQYSLFKDTGEHFRLFKRLNKIISFNNNKYRFCSYGKKSKRIYHPICFLPKESRKHLNVDFNHLDIVNCQPLLLCYHLKMSKLTYDESFIKNVENGQLYEVLQTQLKSKEIERTRDEIKKDFYSQILFDFKTKKNDFVNEAFLELYPDVYKSLKIIHSKSQKNSETLASILQNLEADLFNNLIAENSCYYYTLFDAIYFDDVNDKIDLKRQIVKYFINLNLNVTISEK